ncbi:TPA: phage capsid protein [Escherichia coli]|nr:phage capsid protein [Escherichia coli]
MILGNDYVDLAPLFSAHSTRNYLLSTLDFTDPVGVSSHKVAVSQLVESNESLFNKETSRFSSEHNVTKREQGKEWLIEIPYFLREDVIRPSDVQGKRKPGTDFQETLTDIYAEYVAKHNVAFQRTKESVLAASLFSGKTYTPKTDDVLIEWGKLFNVSAMKATVNASSTDTTKIFKEFDQIATDIIEKAQSQAAAVERIVVFCKPEAFSAIRFSAGMANAFQYVSPLEEGNVVYQRRDLLPGVTAFTIPGTNIDVVKLVDPLHLAHMASDAVAVPKFAKGSNVYQNIYGAASSTFELINAAPAEVYSYSYESSRGDAVNVVTENSQMVVNHGVGFSVQITVK